MLNEIHTNIDTLHHKTFLNMMNTRLLSTLYSLSHMEYQNIGSLTTTNIINIDYVEILWKTISPLWMYHHEFY